MKNLIAVVLAFCLPFFSLAQIPNANFENGDDTSIDGWNLKQGKASTTTSYSFETSFIDTIVNGRFGILEYENNQPAVIESRFAWTKRSKELIGEFIYAPKTSSQRFTIEITYLNWFPALLRNDTVAHSVVLVNPFNNQKYRNYDWFLLTIPVERRDFRNNEEPDSCVITIKIDDAETTDDGTFLLINSLELSDEVLSTNNVASLNDISLFPNPSNSGSFQMQGVSENANASVFDLNGSLIWRGKAINSDQLTLSTGMFLIEIEDKCAIIHKKLQVI